MNSLDVNIKKIKAYRLESGLSQQEAATKIGVSRQSISNWETGKTFPDMYNLILLSELYHVNLNELLGETKIDIDEKSKADNTQENFIYFLLFILLRPIGLIFLRNAIKFNKNNKQFQIIIYLVIFIYVAKDLSYLYEHINNFFS